jgi:predicted ArsR family transcriptional regulator
MNRKQFLSDCACALCSCAAAGLITQNAAAEETKPAEDWRLPFVKQRYAKLIEILAGKVDEATLTEILRQLGYSCASGYWLIKQHKGDVDGFIREFKKQANEDITYDREKGIVTVVGPERTECFCPLIQKNLTSAKVCNCSLGWQQCTYETLLGRKVQVQLTESVLRGGKRCCFQIRVTDQKT